MTATTRRPGPGRKQSARGAEETTMTTTLAENAPPQQPIGAKTLSEVRRNVEQVLSNSPTYWALPQEERKAVANAMVRIGSYLVDGENGKGHERAAALASSSQPPPPDTAGSDF